MLFLYTRTGREVYR